MNFPIKVTVKGKGPETLSKQTYLAAGGEGMVCQKGGLAYKIYHDPKRMIPEAKIRELQVLAGLNNVLGPQDILLDPKSKQPIGFTMPYISKTEFLCRLFNKNFKASNGVSTDMTVEMVKIMQQTLEAIHKENILVVDFNEMNFLTSDRFTNVFFIDVDSYQTPNHKATAIMESIRDRKVVNQQFSELSDWYSFAVVSFQMYMGYHPYRKGKHPNYKPAEWGKRMDDNVSVFHPDITLGDNWKTWDLIPQAHFDWYQRVFGVTGERSIPPLPDGAVLAAVLKPVLISGTDKFDVQHVHDYKDTILGTYFYNGVACVITQAGVYVGTNLVKRFTQKVRRLSLAEVVGTHPVVVSHEGLDLTFSTLDDKKVGTVAADAAMQHNGNIYSIYNGVLLESSFQLIGQKVLHMSKQVAKVFEPATKLFPGVAVQDILGNCWLAIPYKPGACTNIPVKEMDDQRVVDARYENGIFIAITEKDRKYNRYVLHFDEKHQHYTHRLDEDVPYYGINFTTLKNGVCIHTPTDVQVEVFKDNKAIKMLDGPPFNTGTRLVNDSTTVMFVDGSRLYSVRLK